jgi:hypothetical protein
MKTILKIVVALVILTAAFQLAREYLTEYQFEDAVHQGLLFNPRASEAELTDMVMKAAAEYGIDVAASDISVTNKGPEVSIDISYTVHVDLVPGIYSTDVTFNPNATTRFLPGAAR